MFGACLEKSRKAPIYVIYFYKARKGENHAETQKIYWGQTVLTLMVLGVAMPIMIQNGITNFVVFSTTSW